MRWQWKPNKSVASSWVITRSQWFVSPVDFSTCPHPGFLIYYRLSLPAKRGDFQSVTHLFQIQTWFMFADTESSAFCMWPQWPYFHLTYLPSRISVCYPTNVWLRKVSTEFLIVLQICKIWLYPTHHDRMGCLCCNNSTSHVKTPKYPGDWRPLSTARIAGSLALMKYFIS